VPPFSDDVLLQFGELLGFDMKLTEDMTNFSELVHNYFVK